MYKMKKFYRRRIVENGSKGVYASETRVSDPGKGKRRKEEPIRKYTGVKQMTTLNGEPV